MVRKVIFFTVLFFYCFVHPVMAWKITPTTVTLEPKGKLTRQRFVVENPGDSLIPIEISVFAINMNDNGALVTAQSPDEDLFLIYPDQFLLDPKGKQTVTVQWIGEEGFPYEKIYTMLVEQLSLEDDKNDDSSEFNIQINVVLRYLVRLHIKPKGTFSDFYIEQVKDNSLNFSKNEVVVKCKNQGTASGYIHNRNFLITYRSSADKKEREPLQSISIPVQGIPNTNSLFLPQSERYLRIPLPKELIVENVSLEYE